MKGAGYGQLGRWPWGKGRSGLNIDGKQLGIAVHIEKLLSIWRPHRFHTIPGDLMLFPVFGYGWLSIRHHSC